MHTFSIRASAAALPLTVTCESNDEALRLTCSGDNRAGEWQLTNLLHQAPISCVLTRRSTTASMQVLRTYNNSSPAERAAAVTCRADVDGKAKTLKASLAATIRHEVLPIFGRVRVKLLPSPSNSSDVASNPTTLLPQWFERFVWSDDLDQSIEVVTSTAADLELTPPIRHVSTNT